MKTRVSFKYFVNDCSIKARLQDAALISYSAFDKDTSPRFSLSKDEFESLCKFKNEKRQLKVTLSSFLIKTLI